MENYGYVPDESNNGRPYTISRPNSGSKNNLVGVNSRFNPTKKSIYYQRATVLLAAVVVILLIGFVTVVTLYTKSKTTQTHVCTTNECIRSAANLKYSINFSVDPCENFYEFCCGSWSKEHPNHGWYSSFSSFTTITEKIVLESMEVLSEGVKDGEPLVVSQAKMFYASCLDHESIDALGLDPLYEILKILDLPIIPNFFNAPAKDFKFDWAKTEVAMKQVLAMDVFIGFTVGPNIFKRNENVMYLGVLFQSCPLPSPLRGKHQIMRKPWKTSLTKLDDVMTNNSAEEDEDEESSHKEQLKTKIRTNIVKHVVKEVMKDNGRKLPDVKELQLAADIINNITTIMDDLNENFTLPDGQASEDETQKLTFKQLQDFTDNNVDFPLPNFWLNYISSIFANTNVTINADTDLFLITDTELEYLWNVLEYVSSQPPAHIELYMWWAAVYAMIINTSSDVTDYVITQTNLYYSSTTGESFYVTSKFIDCSDLVSKYMGWAVSYAIADRAFANKTKPKVENMINHIKEAFVEHVQGITWMDSSTKKVTLEKSKEMLSFIGYPDWLFKDGAVDRKYLGIEINETTYLNNMVSIIMQYTTESLTKLRLANPRDWTTEAVIVNAYNSFSDNAINVPMAILNYPLYDLGLEVLNYGSIGSILGHELTHGFDNTGRKYDKYGSYMQWWSNRTIETFENMTNCFIKQYDNYTLNGVKGHVKGLATLGENLADNGGLNQAYTAYKNYRKKYGDEPKLPGFEDYSSDQMFFLAYGSIWCESLTTEDLRNQLEYDEHCPNSIRVIGTLQNSEEFAEAYRCPRNSFMNPKREKCKIW
ncbi:unnamed protein product [Ceutorhynchus assimilis]|uniref:Endothelin-converting enzyme 1 n=1 Tax=Ceutorhynchus assimilis TaxID=467358 RepID=A0A9N9MKN3_9CUCU|nr:unnamed protein product [Ceutorhynchus assimilis]